MSSATAYLEDAINYYHTLLQSNLTLAEESIRQLNEGLVPRKLTFGGRPLCNVLRPNLLTRSMFDYVQQVCTNVTQAIAKLGDVMTGNDQAEADRLLNDVGLTDEERRLFAFDTGYKDFSAHSRLDSFLSTDGTMQFVEYNAESPAGSAYEDGLSELFTTLPVMQEFSKKYPVSHADVKGNLLAMLLKNYREYLEKNPFRNKTPNIAIVDWTGVATTTEFELLKDYFERNGHKVAICDPRALEFSNGRLRYNDFEIDLFFKRVLGSELIERKDECRAVFEAYENGAICMINSFRCKIFHKKMIFGLLTDEQNHPYFTPQEIQMIERHIPWTRRVREGKTTYKGQPIDLETFVMENRDRLVLKPNDEYGGKGITIGWDSDMTTWQAAFKAALPEPFVVQEKVVISKQIFPAIGSGKLEFAERLVDCDPYIFDGKLAGLLTRLAATSLLNVTAGTGSTVPSFILENI
jgi:glutathionylspermidine synthase